MTEAIRVVTAGYGSEYVLGNVVQHLRHAGIPCVELDMLFEEWRRRLDEAPTATRTVLLTSQHPVLDTAAYTRHHGLESDNLSLTETIALVRPDKTFFFAHDLSDQMHAEEVLALGEVTAALMPDERTWWLRRWVDVHVIGWVKSVQPLNLPSLPTRPWAFMPTDVITYSLRDIEHFHSAFGDLTRMKPAFKLPVYPGLDQLRKVLLDAGCHEIDAGVSASTVVNAYPTLISNGVSSTLAEAALAGKDVLCIMDGIHEPAKQMRLFGRYANVTFCKPAEVARALQSPERGRTFKPSLQPFDFDLLLRLIRA
jgi:hypothetical protein